MFKRRFFEECFNNFVPTKKVSEVQNNTETHWQEQYLLLCSGEQSHKGLNVIMVSIWWQNWHFWVKRWNWQFFKICQSPSLLCFTYLAILPLKYMLVCSAASWPSLTLLLPSAVSYVYKALISELLHLSQDYIGSVYSTLTEEQMPDAHTKYTWHGLFLWHLKRLL